MPIWNSLLGASYVLGTLGGHLADNTDRKLIMSWGHLANTWWTASLHQKNRSRDVEYGPSDLGPDMTWNDTFEFSPVFCSPYFNFILTFKIRFHPEKVNEGFLFGYHTHVSYIITIQNTCPFQRKPALVGKGIGQKTRKNGIRQSGPDLSQSKNSLSMGKCEHRGFIPWR